MRFIGWVMDGMTYSKRFRNVVIAIGSLFVLFIVLLSTGCPLPLIFDYFDYPRYQSWCWGPKNDKGEYTVLYTVGTEKMRHLKGAGMFGYKKLGEYVQLRQVNIDGSGNKVVYEEKRESAFWVDYCQKTRRLLVLDNTIEKGRWIKNELYHMKFDGSDKKVLLTDYSEEDFRGFEFSPDGTKVAFVTRPSMRTSDWNIWLMDAEGGERKWIGRSDDVCWYPSGKYLCDGGNILDLDGHIIFQFYTLFTPPLCVSTPCFSPDGNFLVGYCTMLRIKRMGGEGKEKWMGERMWAPGAGNSPKWSPCGRYIIEGWEGGVSIVDLLYGDTSKFVTPGQSGGDWGREQERKCLKGFRQWVQENDPEWWDKMIRKFPRR